MAKNISFTIKFWRQNGPKDAGHFDTHEMKDIPDDRESTAHFGQVYRNKVFADLVDYNDRNSYNHKNRHIVS